MFEGFPKIPRYSRECVITEKIDGTNAQIYIWNAIDGPNENIKRDGMVSYPCTCVRVPDNRVETGFLAHFLSAGSRKRWITPEDDNFGFARWVYENAEELVKLGPGRHFGEWWGRGIQRGYDLNEKRFSLFNVARWGDHNPNTPECVSVVPTLYKGTFAGDEIVEVMQNLVLFGSVASPGYLNPEGIVIWHKDSRQLYKKTFEDDEKGKSRR